MGNTFTKMKKIRIALIIDYLDVGGTETQIRLLLAGLNREIFDPMVYCIKEAGRTSKHIEKLGIEVVLLPQYTFPKHPLGARLRQTLWLSFSLRRRKIKIVQNYLLTANIFGTLAAKLAGVPVICASERSASQPNVLNFDTANHPKRNQTFKKISKWCNAVIGNSQMVADYLRDTVAISPEKIHVIQNGIDQSRFQGIEYNLKSELGLSPQKKLIGKIARLVLEKNHPVLLDAVSLLAKERQDFCLILIGDGPMRLELESQVERLKLQKCVRFLGERTDIPQILSGLDMVVQSSNYEGMPNALMEGMAAKKAVVATDVGGTGELIIHQKTGLLVPPNNAEALATALSTLLDDPTLATQLAEKGFQHLVDGFSVEKMVDKTQQIYLDFLKVS